MVRATGTKVPRVDRTLRRAMRMMPRLPQPATLAPKRTSGPSSSGTRHGRPPELERVSDLCIRPIGVILLAAGSGLLVLYNLYKMLVYLGIVNIPIGQSLVNGGDGMSFNEAAVGRRPVDAADRGHLGLGRPGFLEPARLRGPVRHLHQPVHADLGLLRPPVRLHRRGRDHPLAARRLHLPVPQLPGRPAGLHREREVQADT